MANTQLELCSGSSNNSEMKDKDITLFSNGWFFSCSRQAFRLVNYNFFISFCMTFQIVPLIKIKPEVVKIIIKKRYKNQLEIDLKYTISNVKSILFP